MAKQPRKPKNNQRVNNQRVNNQRGNNQRGNNQRGNNQRGNSQRGNNQRGNNQRGNNQEFDNEMRGALFVNNRAQSDRSPDMTGNVTIDGKQWWISAWWKTPRGNGDDYLSLAVTDPDESQNSDQDDQWEPDQGNGDMPF